MVKWEKILTEVRRNSAWSKFSIRISEEGRTISSRKKKMEGGYGRSLQNLKLFSKEKHLRDTIQSI